jgi:hypothetical protein
MHYTRFTIYKYVHANPVFLVEYKSAILTVKFLLCFSITPVEAQSYVENIVLIHKLTSKLGASSPNTLNLCSSLNVETKFPTHPKQRANILCFNLYIFRCETVVRSHVRGMRDL